jgi:hypothetical protein
MRVFSNTTALSRRSIMHGMVATLASASVSVAAIAGLTARSLTAMPDTSLLAKCSQWQERHKELQRLEAEMSELSEPVLRLQDKWDELDSENWQLYREISQSDAATLQGVSAQVDVLETFGARKTSICETTEHLMDGIMQAVQRLAVPSVGA